MRKQRHNRVSAWPTLLWLMLLALLPAQLSARDFSYTYEGNTVNYTVLDEDAKTVTTKVGVYSGGQATPGSSVSGILTIPEKVTDEEGVEYTVSQIAQNSFPTCDITGLNLPSTIEFLGAYAFQDCTGLTSVILPPSLTSTGNYPFQRCTGLLKCAYPSTLAKNPFSSSATVACSGQVISYPATAIVEDGMIFNDDKTTLWFVSADKEGEFTIPEGVVTLGKYAFPHCNKITSINFGESVETIEDSAFNDCTGLISLILPTSLKNVGSSLFDGSYNLAKGAYPSSISNPFPTSGILISTGSFSSVEYPVNGSLIEDGYIWSEDKTTLYFVPYNVTGEFVLPSSVTTIGDCAFAQCKDLTGITFNNSLKTIGGKAFRNCDGINEFILPPSLLEVTSEAFVFLTPYKAAYPSTLTRNPFNGVYTVQYPVDNCLIDSDGNIWSKDKTTLYYVTFNTAGEFTIPESVVNVGDFAFVNCSNITDINFGESVETIGNNAFQNCDGLTSITFGNSVKTIGDYAFQKCDGLTSITLGNSVKTIGDYAFYKCNNLTSITSEASVPPVFMADAFYEYDFSLYDTAEVIVPDAEMTSYLCTQWSLFKTLKGADSGFVAEEFSDDVFTYRTSSETEACVMKGDYTSMSSVSIPERVVLDDTFKYVTGIGPGAFEGCPMSTLVLPKRLKYIGENAFKGCSKLEEVTLPATVTTIYSGAFQSCTSLTSANLNDGLLSLGSSAFANCTSLASADIPCSVGDECFSDDYNLTTVTLSDKVSAIGDKAFYWCSALASIALPDALTSIGLSAFEKSGLTAITVPASCELGNRAFADCRSLASADIPCSVSDECFSGDYELTTVTLSDKVSAIGDKAFYNCSALASIALPDALTSIGLSAFEYSGLTSISVPASCELGNRAFYNCQSLQSANIACSVSASCFGGDSKLETVVLSDNAYTIGDYAFSDCNSLKSITLNQGLSAIGEYAFRNNSDLSSIEIPATVETIGEYAFENSGLTAITVPASCELADYAFYNCKSLVSANIGGSVGASCFVGDTQLETVVLSDNAYTIGNYAFSDCNSLKSVTLNHGLFSIGKEAFKNNNLLPAIAIPATVETIGEFAFSGCRKLKDFQIEDGENAIELGDGILENCPVENLYLGRDYVYNGTGTLSSSIKTLTLGNLVTTVADNAFANLPSLSTLTLGTSVKTIGANAFQNCALTEVVMSPATETIGENAFAGNALTNIALGANVTEIGEKAFDGANQLAGVSITALTPPMAQNNTFSYYGCPLYVSPSANDEVKDAYYNFTRCWYRFSGYDLIEAESVEIEGQATITLKPGESLKLSAAIVPANASLPYIFWRSTNPAFATVDGEGNVTVVPVADGGIAAYADGDEEVNECQIIAETLYANGPVAQITLRTETSGIENVVEQPADFQEVERPNHIYTLQGMLIKLNASQEDIDALAPGLYIISGKKVLVK